MSILSLPFRVKPEEERFFDRYDAAIAEKTAFAEISDLMNKALHHVEEYRRLRIIEYPLRHMTLTETAVKNARAVYPSQEASVFTIARAIIMAIYGAAKWTLGLIGKIFKFIGSFFKREIKDAVKVIEDIGDVVPLCGSEVMGLGIAVQDVILIEKIVKSHSEKKDVVPTGTPGMKIDDYKRLYFEKFNAAVINEAKVSPKGILSNRPHGKRNARLNALGWTTKEVLLKGADSLTNSEEAVQSILDDLKDKSSDMKKIINLCESNGYVKNRFIEEKGPETIDAACLCSILVNDVKIIKQSEDVFTKMVYSVEKASKKYVAAKK